MENEDSFELFSSRCNAEWDFIINCKTNTEFIDAVSGRLLVFFRNDPIIKCVVADWDAQLRVECDLRYQACRELSNAIEEIREVSQKNISKDPNSSFLRLIEKLSVLKKTTTDHYFSDKVEKILEIIRSGGYCVNLEEAPIFWDWNEVLRKGIYGDLKSLYELKFSTDNLTFAPSAFKLTTEGKTYVKVVIDTNLLRMWKKLAYLEKCWSYRDSATEDDRWWPRVEGDGLELLLKADYVRQQAFVKMMASKLRYVDEPNFDKSYFDRVACEKIIQYLFTEILERLFPSNYEKIKRDSEKKNIKKQKSLNPRSQRHLEDIEVLTPINIKIWHQEIIDKEHDPEGVSYAYIVQLMKKHVNKNGIVLQAPSSNLYDKVARSTSPKVYNKAGKYLGLSSNFH